MTGIFKNDRTFANLSFGLPLFSLWYFTLALWRRCSYSVGRHCGLRWYCGGLPAVLGAALVTTGFSLIKALNANLQSAHHGLAWYELDLNWYGNFRTADAGPRLGRETAETRRGK
jgi:hypothetical protein